ncbi:hypothetical protein C8F04DRAFT_1391358, partial [Mycena alexandri]
MSLKTSWRNVKRFKPFITWNIATSHHPSKCARSQLLALMKAVLLYPFFCLSPLLMSFFVQALRAIRQRALAAKTPELRDH